MPLKNSQTVDRALVWNQTARDLIAEFGLDPVSASRVLFLLTVSQCLMLPDVVTESNDLVTARAIDVGSTTVLAELFPAFQNRQVMPQFCGDHSLTTSLHDVRRFLLSRRRDGSARRTTVQVPIGTHYWRSIENRPPVRPHWGQVRAFGIELDATLEQHTAPPTPGSADHMTALEEVQELSRNPTAEQLSRVNHWACSIGGETPSGGWQNVLEPYVKSTSQSAEEVLYRLAVAHSAMFNSGILCWRMKYRYWYPRPVNVDSRTKMWIQLPNFPSFTSGHSAFSWAVIGALGLNARDLTHPLVVLADQASESRILAGVHYRFDCTSGLEMGMNAGSATTLALPSIESVKQCALSECMD